MVKPCVPYSRPARFAAGPRHPSAVDVVLRRELLGRVWDMVAVGEVFLLTGAGVSTWSGIPDYRGPDGVRVETAPMTYQQFVGDSVARRRYWARSFFGWQVIAAAKPNVVHREIGAWDAAGLLRGIVTQNVDGLHQAGGAVTVEELHGNLHRVVCLDCGELSGRRELARRLAEVNPALSDGGDAVGEVAPDGDVSVNDAVVERFVMVPCGVCGGERLKPDVVYFGENVPVDRVNRVRELLRQSASVVVLGSSLTVMSGYRFVRDAVADGKPVAIVTQGVSRGDRHATLRVDSDLAEAVRFWGERRHSSGE